MVGRAKLRVELEEQGRRYLWTAQCVYGGGGGGMRESFFGGGGQLHRLCGLHLHMLHFLLKFLDSSLLVLLLVLLAGEEEYG